MMAPDDDGREGSKIWQEWEGGELLKR